MEIVKKFLIGDLKFCFLEEGVLSKIEFLKTSDNRGISKENNNVTDLILAYLSDADCDLSTIKLFQSGTDYQKKVWNFLQKIQKGTTITYSELSKKVGGSPRSVANALRHNPLPILFPCHRVVAKSGIGGFSGQTKGKMIDIKRYLLQLEGVKNV